MKKLLTICPTRGRLSICKQMADSFNSTAEDAELILCVDQDDPDLDKYKDVHYNVIISHEGKTTTELINITFNKYPEYKYYNVTNDDFFYHTKFWDTKLISLFEEYGHGIAYGNDLLMGQKLPTTSIISGDIVRALGWLQMPDLKHLYGDEVWKHVGMRIGCLYYREDVIIEHRHWIKYHRLIDDTYKRTNSQALYAEDGLAFQVWKDTKAENDIKKIKEAIWMSV